MQTHYPRRSTTRRHHRPAKKTDLSHMKPEAEPILKSVFARIGKPDFVPFSPDTFQIEALKAAQEADCLVVAPTGSGKTWIAQEAIRSIYSRGGRCWYASPLKALTNAKWVEFGDIFGDGQVGILTGDTKENTDAPIIVGTTEILRNQLYDVMHHGEDLDCDLVILDEAHFLGDPDRGVVWEEILIYLPARVNILMLSATIGNAEEITQWLISIRRKPCTLIHEGKRPVPLYPLFLHPSGRIMPYLEKQKIYARVVPFATRGTRPPGYRPQPHFGEIIDVLERFNLLPAIFFLKSRSDCDAALKSCRHDMDPVAKDSFGYDLEDQLSRSPYLRNHKQLRNLVHARVAAHHGGQLPAWKFLVESMMKRGHLKAIFATSTVAAGVNFPARTIILFNSDLFNGHDFSPLNPTEFHQMTGRAGRRGQDRIGFLVVLPGRFMDLVHVRKLLFQEPEDILSQINTNFSMILNLLLSHTPADIRDIFAKSLAGYQLRQRGRTPESAHKKPASLWDDFLMHLRFLKGEGFVDDHDRLTETGAWASKLRLDQPLLIAECLRCEAFPRKDENLLAAVVAPFVYDGDQETRIDLKKMPKRLAQACLRMVRTIKPISQRMDKAGFTVQPMSIWTSVVMYDWAKGGDWDEILQRAGIADGDMAMLVLRTADNLRQIMSLRQTHPEMADLALKARDAILREPVVFG